MIEIVNSKYIPFVSFTTTIYINVHDTMQRKLSFQDFIIIGVLFVCKETHLLAGQQGEAS